MAATSLPELQLVHCGQKHKCEDVRVVKEGPGRKSQGHALCRSLGIPSGGQAVAALFLKFPLCSISLQSPSHPHTLSGCLSPDLPA